MKACKFYTLLLILWALIISPHAAFSQAESHNFITYDTTYNVGYGNLSYIFRITRPKNMFVGGDPDWAARPAIIQMGGAGEVGTNAALTAVNGPHYWLAHGWDGSVQLANGTHYPIIISVQAIAQWPQTTEILNMLKYILKTYHIKSNSVHLCGLSMGAFSWSAMICHQSTPGGEDGMKLVTSLVCLEGQSTGVSTAVIPNELPGFNSFGHWAKKYKGKFFGLEGTADYRNVGAVSDNMNDSVPGSAFFSYETIGGGAHCCWNSMYDPSATNWTSVGTLGPNNAKGANANAMGTYKAPMSIFQWMLSQGDISLVNAGTPTPNQAPVVNAGSAQTITLPTSSLTLTGNVTDEGGALTYAWTQVSGPSTATIATGNAVNTVVSGLQAGTYVFKLAVTDAGSLTGSGTVQVVVNAAAPSTTPPTVSAGTSQTLTLPVALTTLKGTATPAPGTTISSYSWKQMSGGVSVLLTPNAATTTVTGLLAGTNVYRLTATGSNGVSAYSDVQITVNPLVTIPPVIPLPGLGLTVKKVIVCEYRCWYIASDNNVYSWNNGSLNVMQFPIGGRKAVDGVGGFNVFRVLDDQGYIWTSKIDFTTNTTRFDTDTTGAPFNGNASVYAYATTTLTIKTDGSVWLFGNDTMHLFHTTGAVNMRPTQLSPAGLQFKKLVIGNRIVGLTTTGDVYEWTYGGSRTPTKKTIPAAAIDIFGSHLDYFGCIIPATAGGTTGYPYVWGTANRAWGGTAPYTQPTSVQTLWGVVNPIKEICANWNTTHYIDDQGRMWGFGFNVSGEVGNGKEMANQYNYKAPYSWDFTDYANPSGLPFQEIGKGVKWSKFFSNNFFVFFKYALDENDSVYSWGRNKAMVLGNGLINQQEQYYPNSLDVLVPTMVHPLTAIYQPYNFTLPSLSAGANQNINTTTAVLTGAVKAPLLVKTTAVANNKIDTAGYKIVNYLWTRVSGTGGTITSPNSLSTTVTGLTPGTYVFNLLTTDNNTGTLSSNVTITVSAPGANTPVANAGGDQAITLPTNSATLKGSGSEVGGTIASYAWKQLSGPSTANITAANQPQTDVNTLVQGVYIFQLTVTDAAGVKATDAVTVTVNAAPVVPGTPVANAGSDQTITLPTNSLSLKGIGTETNGTIVSYQWSQMSGPSTASIVTANQAITTVNTLVQGTYVFRLIIKDNSGVTASDDVSVTVKAAPVVPGTPVANAGIDQVITLPTNMVTLAGSGSETNGTIASYAWTQVSGPSTATLVSAGQSQTDVNSLVQGTYVFRLTVKDNSGVTATDNITVVVNPAPVVPGTPIANAGGDKNITLPTNSVTLVGSGSEVNGAIVSYAWTQDSGPSTATIATANQAQTVINGLVQGVYVFRLKVTDNSGITASDVVTVTVAPPVPGAPVANAGGDQTITLPTNNVTLKGSGSEVNGTIVSYAWTQVSGPSTAAIATANQAQTGAGSLLAGTYVFRLTVKDNSGVTDIDDVTITVTAAPVVPGSPVANAGTDQSMTLPTNTYTLKGSGSETNGTIVSYKWIQVSGPSTAVIVTSDQAATYITGMVQGSYVFQLTITDNSGVTASDKVTITVNPAAVVPGAPVANAGTDQTIVLPISNATLAGIGSETNGTIVSYQWTQVSGPSTAAIGTAGQAQTGVTGLVAGTYVFRLTVKDNSGITATDDISITVNPAPVVPGTPMANAGGDKTITLPTNSVTLVGSGSEVNGAIVGYTWTQESGPTTATIVTANQAQTIVSGLAQGVYTFRLRVRDNSNITASDLVTVTVNAAAPVPGNPVANAGGDQTITLPTNNVKLTGSGSETNGTIVSYVWKELSGPSTATIATPSLATTVVSSLVQGVYTFVLTVTDNSGVTASDVVTVTVKAATPPPPPPNTLPIANAGKDQTTASTSGVTLDGTASYDPDGTIVKYSWIQVSGSGGVTLGGSNTTYPSLSGLKPGTYVFRLTVTDNSGATASDEVTITVTTAPVTSPAAGNQAPVANAGTDTTVIYPHGNIARLTGSASYDPDGSIVSYSWKQVSGPTTANISGATDAIATVNGLAVGDYVFELTVTDDKGVTATATVTVHVKSNERDDPRLKLYPNPAINHQVTLEGMNSYIGKVKITMSDVGGRLIKQFEVNKEMPTMKQTLDLSGIGRGVYVLRVQFYLDTKPTVYMLVVN